MRKDSILANYYYKKLPKYQQKPGTVTAPAKKKKTMIFAETNVGNPFVTEGNEVKEYLKNVSPDEDVQVYDIYNDEAKMRELLANSDENTRLAFFAHHGSNLYGNPAENLGQMLQNTTYGDCYLGSCYSGDIAAKPEFANLQNFHFRPNFPTSIYDMTTHNTGEPGRTWQGFNPRTKTNLTGENAINEAMFNTTTDPMYFTIGKKLGELYEQRLQLYSKYNPDGKKLYRELEEDPNYKKEFDAFTKLIDENEAKLDKFYTTVRTPVKGVDYDILNPTPGGHKASGVKYLTEKEKVEQIRQQQLAQAAAEQNTKVTNFLSSRFRDGGNASSLNYRNGLPKVKGGRMITDPRGQWAHPGQNTRIPGGNITMQGVPYPVFGRANTGQTMMMQPGGEYNFPGASHVDEYPMMGYGGLAKYQNAGTVCPTGYTKNAFGVCVNASGQTPDQAKAGSSSLNLSGKTSTVFDGSKYSGNSGNTGVSRINFDTTPEGKLHTATLNYMKQYPGMTYQQASDNVKMSRASSQGQGSVRAMTTNEVEKNRIDTENENFRKSFKVGMSDASKVEVLHKENEEKTKEIEDIQNATSAIENGTPYTFPNGDVKPWKDMDGRERAYVQGIKFRKNLMLFPDAKPTGSYSEAVKSTIEDLNPFPTASRWVAQGLESPYIARETNSVMPYIAAVADPAISIGLASIGAPEGGAGKQIVKSLFTPAKPIKEALEAAEAVSIGKAEDWAIKTMTKKGRKYVVKGAAPEVKSELGTGAVYNGVAEQPKAVSPYNAGETDNINTDFSFRTDVNSPTNMVIGENMILPKAKPLVYKMGGKYRLGGKAIKNNWLDKYI